MVEETLSAVLARLVFLFLSRSTAKEMLDFRADFSFPTSPSSSTSLALILVFDPSPLVASFGKYSSLEPWEGTVDLGDTSESDLPRVTWGSSIAEAVASAAMGRVSEEKM